MLFIKHILPQFAAGAIAGIVALAGLLVPGDVRQLIARDPSGWIVLLLLSWSFIAIFGLAAVGCSFAMAAARDDVTTARRDRSH